MRRIQARFVDIERRQVEALERTTKQAAGRFAEAAALQFDSAVKSAREDAARRLARELDRAVHMFAREAESVLAERLAQVADTGTQRVEKRLLQVTAGLERQRDEFIAELQQRLSQMEHEVRDRLRTPRGGGGGGTVGPRPPAPGALPPRGDERTGSPLAPNLWALAHLSQVALFQSNFLGEGSSRKRRIRADRRRRNDRDRRVQAERPRQGRQLASPPAHGGGLPRSSCGAAGPERRRPPSRHRARQAGLRRDRRRRDLL